MAAARTVLFLFLFLITAQLVLGNVIINEVMPNPSGTSPDNEWIEIYSDTGEDNLLNWTFTDGEGTFLFPNISILPQSRIVLINTWSGSDPLPANYLEYGAVASGSLTLSNSGEEILLTKNDGQMFDNVTYPSFSTKIGKTYARLHDGNFNWITAAVPTLGAANNQLPVAIDDNASTLQNTPLSINVLTNDYDNDSDILTISSVNNGSNGTTSINGTILNYTPQIDFYGTDSFDYTISDGFGGTATATVTVTVIQNNDFPIAPNQSVTTNEDTPKTITLIGTDSDGSIINYLIITNSTHGTIQQNNDQIIYSPASNYNGQDNFTFKVIDNKGNESNTATVSITVIPVNDAPIANNQSITTMEDTPINIILIENDTENDIEGDALTYTITSGPTHGILSPAVGLTYIPTPDYFGPDSFTFTANDGTIDSATATVSITIAAVNDAPAITTSSFDEATQGITSSYQLQVNDIDSSPSNLSIDLSQSTIYGESFSVISPNPYLNIDGLEINITFPASGIIPFHIVVTDGQDTSNRDFNLTVNPTLEITEVKVNNISYNNGDATDNFNPGDELNFELTLKNHFTQARHEIVPDEPYITHIIFNANGDLLDFPTPLESYLSPPSQFLEAQQEKTLNFTYRLPYTLPEDRYHLNFEVKGLDLADNYYDDNKELNIIVTKESHTITITDVQTDNQLSCAKKQFQPNAPVTITVVNTGSTTEDVTFKISSAALNYTNLLQTTIDPEMQQNILFDLGLQQNVGNYNFNITAYRTDEVPILIYQGTRSFSIDVANCPPDIGMILPLELTEDTSSIFNLSDYINNLETSQPLTYTITRAANVTLSLNRSLLTLTPLSDWYGHDKFNLTVGDGLNSTTMEVHIIVNQNFTDDPAIIASISSVPSLIKYNDDSIYINTVTRNPDIQPLTYQWFVDNVRESISENFSFNATGLGLGNHSIRFLFNSGQPSQTEKNWNLTVADRPVDGNLFDVELSQIIDISSTPGLTLENTQGKIAFQESTDLTNLLHLADVVIIGSNIVAINSASAPGLNHPAIITLYGQFTTPEILESDLFNSNNFSTCPASDCQILSNANGAVVFNVKHFSTYSVQEKIISPNNLTISKLKINGGSSGKLKLKDLNEISVTIGNNFDQTLEDVTITLRLLSVDGGDLEEEVDSFILNSGKDKVVSADFDLSDKTLDGDSYTVEVEVTATGKSDDKDYDNTESKDFDVERSSHKIILQNMVLSDNQITCDRQTSLDVTIENIAKNNEDNVEITLKNSILGIDQKVSNIKLDDYSGSNTKHKTAFSLDLTNAAPGTYPLTIAVNLDEELQETKDLSLAIGSCLSQDSAAKPTTNYADGSKLSPYAQLKTITLSQKTTPPVVRTTFRNTNTYLMLLGIIVGLLLLALMLVLTILLVKRRRR